MKGEKERDRIRQCLSAQKRDSATWSDHVTRGTITTKWSIEIDHLASLSLSPCQSIGRLSLSLPLSVCRRKHRKMRGDINSGKTRKRRDTLKLAQLQTGKQMPMTPIDSRQVSEMAPNTHTHTHRGQSRPVLSTRSLDRSICRCQMVPQ